MDAKLANQKAVQLFQRFSDKYGLLLSMQKQFPQDSNQRPLPLYTYPACEYLQSFDLSAENVFGYSCGASALWWSMVARYVFTIELDERVHTFLRTRQQAKLQSIWMWRDDREGFRRSIESVEMSPGIVAVDVEGSQLAEIAEYVAEQIAADKIRPKLVVVNNAGQARRGLEALGALPRYLQIDFHGLGPVVDNTWTTTLFLNCDDRLPGYRFRPSAAALGA